MTHISLIGHFDTISRDQIKKEISLMTSWLNGNIGKEKEDWKWLWDWHEAGAWHSYPTGVDLRTDQDAVAFKLTFGIRLS